MTSQTHTRLLALMLIVLGLGIMANKVMRYDYPLRPGEQTTVWDFEIFLQFDARNEPVRIETFLPVSGAGSAVSEEQFYNGAFGLRLDERGANRKAIWTYRYPNDRKVLRYRAKIIGASRDTPLPETMKRPGRRFTPEIADDVARQAFIVWSADLRRQSADDESLAELIIQQIFGDAIQDEVEVLLPALPRPLDRLELARQVLESQGIQARVANGVYLDDARRRAEVRHWLEYHVEASDKRFFPSGRPGEFVTLWFGTDPLVKSAGTRELDVQIGLQPARLAAEAVVLNAAGQGDFTLSWFNFETLPITTQLVYQVLVTIPVGILLLVFLRQFVGIQTLGTFMPVLIGIAFRETALVTGLLLFSGLVLVGLAMRFYLERLKLLLVPRLAVVLVFIVICMAAITLGMQGAGQPIGLSVSLFPMVILTMTIERMSIVWEEASATDALKQGAGSLLVASLAYLAMTHPQVEYMMFNFPELLFAIMGLCLLMGKYTGLRLSELIRFRQLAGRT